MFGFPRRPQCHQIEDTLDFCKKTSWLLLAYQHLWQENDSEILGKLTPIVASESCLTIRFSDKEHAPGSVRPAHSIWGKGVSCSGILFAIGVPVALASLISRNTFCEWQKAYKLTCAPLFAETEGGSNDSASARREVICSILIYPKWTWWCYQGRELQKALRETK